MIDIHAHILPNIDDGAINIEETMNLLKEAQDAGFTTVVATSHYMEGYYETAVAERELLLNAVKQKLKQYNLNLELFLGNEIYLSENTIQLLEERKASSINDTNYVLFEMPLHSKPMNMYDVIYDMIQYKLVPILAHPERYTFIQKDPELIYDLIDLGVLMQANYASIIGYYGEKAQIIVKKLLECNMVHFLGSDVHRQNTIYANMNNIIEELKKVITKQEFKLLTEINPRKIINNEEIATEQPIKIKENFSKFFRRN